MDPDSPLSRVERTLWTVWAYISGAVNRFLRPPTANTNNNDPDSLQESSVDGKPPDCGPAEGDTGEGGSDEERPLATASQLGSSRPVVVWEHSATDIDLRPDEESVQYKKERRRSSGGEESADGEGRSEEQMSQTGHDDADDGGSKEDEQEKVEIEKFGAQDETPEDDEQHVNTESRIILTDDAIVEESEKTERKAGDEEKAVSAATLDERQEIDETVMKTQVEEEESEVPREDEQDLKADEVKLCTMMDSSPEEEEEEVLRGEAGMQRENAAPVVTEEEEAEICDGLSQLASDRKTDEGTRQAENQLEVSDDDVIAVGRESMMVGGSESDKFEDEGLKEDEREEEEQDNEAASNRTTDEESKEEENIGTVADGSHEEDVLTECEEAVQLNLAELTDKEQQDVALAEVQTKARDLATTCVSLDDKDQAEEERLSSEAGDKDVEVECTVSSVTVKLEGETGQEISGELGNAPPGVSEGQVVASQRLNTPECEETQEGVPGYNNELVLNENTTQWFLEAGDYEERQTTRLPEEVESEELESLQNSGWSTGADYLLVTEPMEEEQEGGQDVKCSFDSAVVEDTGIQQFTDTGLTEEAEKPLAEALTSEHIFEEEGGKLLESSMKAEIKHVSWSEELLLDFGIDGGFCDSKEADAGRDGAVAADEAVGLANETSEFLEAEVQKMTEASFSKESVHEVHTELNSSIAPSLLDDISAFGFLKPLVEIEPNLLEDSSLEMLDAGIDVEEEGFGEEEEETEDETHLQDAGMAAEPITETKEKGNSLITESELSQSPDGGLEIREEEMITEVADELRTTEFQPKDSSADETTKIVDWSFTEETSDSIGGPQDVIDEEILDLWIEAVTSEDADGTKQEEAEPEQRMDTEADPLNEEQGDITSEKDKEQLMEPNSGESGLASDTEMSSSTVESGFFNQSLSEWDAQNSETQLLKSASTSSLQDVQGVSTSEPADVSESSVLPPNSEALDAQIEETAERVQSYLKEEAGFHPESVEERNLNQESGESQEETVDQRVESGSEKETDVEVTDQTEKTDWKHNEEVDITPLTEMGPFFQIEETKSENEPLEISVSDSAHEIKHTEYGSGSEASLEEEIVSIELDSQGDAWTEERIFKLPSLDEPQPGWSEAESLFELKRPEVAEEPTTKSEDQEKAVAPLLDFTLQRSRIAVKNPRARPPKDPRSLLHMPSVDPTPSMHAPVKAPIGVPLGGLGIGIKLPGLGAGFPVLKKTQRVVKEENSQDTPSEEPEVKPEQKSDAPQQDEVQRKPKWMPPRHPGFGNPLMSELKTKLKKPTQE